MGSTGLKRPRPGVRGTTPLLALLGILLTSPWIVRKSAVRPRGAQVGGRNSGASLFRSVLVALDGSSRSERSLPWVPLLARPADTLLLRVDTAGLALSPDAAQLAPMLALEANRYIAELGLAKTPASRRLVVTGTASTSILEVAAQQEADLVVITTHGGSRIRRRVPGGTAEKLIHHHDVLSRAGGRETGSARKHREPSGSAVPCPGPSHEPSGEFHLISLAAILDLDRANCAFNLNGNAWIGLDPPGEFHRLRIGMVQARYTWLCSIVLIALFFTAIARGAISTGAAGAISEVQEFVLEFLDPSSKEPHRGKDSQRPRRTTESLERQEATSRVVEQGLSKHAPSVVRLPWRNYARAPVRPSSTTLVQVTKPDSLRIFLLATPLNPRSPPA